MDVADQTQEHPGNSAERQRHAQAIAQRDPAVDGTRVGQVRLQPSRRGQRPHMVRLDRITTRTGDDGTTGLSDGSRLPKHHPLIVAIGAVDEANTVIGLARCEQLPPAIASALALVQNDLFDLGGDLATPPGGPYEERIPRIVPAQVTRLEAAVDTATAQLTPLRSFVLPGGTRAAAQLHLCRVSVRAAERAVAAAQAGDPGRILNPEILRYLNRLSDVCFVWARLANDGGRGDVAWIPGANRG